MRVTRFIVAFAIWFGGCGIDGPAPRSSEAAVNPRPERPRAKSDGAISGRFRARTDAGELVPLELRSFAARVAIRPGTVRTHLAMEVAGPKNERAEAVMRLRVPRGAAVESAILWVSGRPMKGAFVERDHAREIYRSIVARRRDPALVTWDGPEWVVISIFPLEGGEPRRLELDWVEPRVTGAPVRYRVPTIVDGDRLIGRATLEVDGKAFATAGRDLVELPVAGDPKPGIIAGRVPGDPFFRLLVPARPANGPPRVVVVAETSAAMTLWDRALERKAIDTALARLPADARVTLLAADWQAPMLADNVVRADAVKALAKLDGVVSAGALRLERVLAEAASRAHGERPASVLFVGRGADGFGGDPAVGPLEALQRAGARLSIVTIGGQPAPLADAASLSGGETLPAAQLGASLADLDVALRALPARPLDMAPGTEEWHALEAGGGETFWVGRALTAPAGDDGSSRLDPTDAADLMALWDRARLMGSERGRRRAGRAFAAALTPLRALLVLETEADYARYGLATPGEASSALGNDAAGGEPPKNASILDTLGLLEGTGVGAGGTGEGTIGLSGLHTIGTGAGHGGGSAYGGGVAGLGAPSGHSPEVVAGQCTVRGSLDKEIVRRIVRRHINEVRYCYEQSLSRNPELAGRVQVQFTIGPSGQVRQSTLEGSTAGAPRVERCIVDAVRRWEFPQTMGGGEVVVSYPFVLTPGPSPRAATARAPDHPDGAEHDPLALEALAILAEKGPLADRTERIAIRLGLDRTREPEVVAWSIDRSAADVDEMILVARLLAAAGRQADAVRVLSERAATDPVAVAKELRRLKADADADAVLSLANRAQARR